MARSTRLAAPSRCRSVVLLAAALVVLAQLVAPVQSASATSYTLVATPTSTVLASPNSTTNLSGLAISGDPVDVLQATLATDIGTISIPTHPNTTLAYDNAWSGAAEVSFIGTQADIDTALASAQLVTGSATGTAHISLTALISQSNYNFSAPNQHFYQYVAAPHITWFDADAAAKQMSYGGQQGYLATIPSQAVNDFISSKIAGATNVWLGARAYEATATDGTAGLATVNGTTYPRVWRWTSGSDESPIQGQVISTCTQITGAANCTNAGYAGWSVGNEPNNARGSSSPYSGEYTAVTNWGGSSGVWNDIAPDYYPDLQNVNGYVVEYGGKTNADPSLGTGFGGVVTSTTDVRVASSATVPSAPTLAGTRGNASATVSWNPPPDGGSPITGYQYSLGGGSWTSFTPTSTSAVVNGNTVVTDTFTLTGLSNGTPASIQVLAVNAVGTGASSTAVLVTPATVPGAPTSVVATRGDASASVAFAAPGSTGGSAITGYTVTASPGGAAASCVSSPCSVTGLTNGTAYTFTVHATNGVGDGAESSASSAVTPATVPGVPSGLTVTSADSAVAVAFTPPADNGAAISSYLVTASPGGASNTCTSSPCAVTGLTNGTSYTFTVRATNAVGDGATSSPSAAAVPATVPGAPTSVVATRGNASASIAFTAPVSNGGSAITSYTATASPGGASATCSSSPCAVTGLTNGTSYTFTVAATNGVSTGPSSAPSAAAVPATVPDAPTSVVATRGSASAAVAFAAPSGNGSAITSYTVTSTPGGATASCSSSPCTVTGLTDGTSYTFVVHATNGVGASADSAASLPTVPGSVPSAPRSLTATRGDGQATVSFSAPATDGGYSISGYLVTASPGGATATCSSSPCTVTGLTNGTDYVLTVHAVNAIGDGADASSTSVRPATVPGTPTGVQAAASDGALSVSWTAPASSGGEPITGYRVTVTPGGGSATCASSPCTVSGLVNGTAVTVRVIASNAVGDSAASPASASVTPAGPPATPTGFTVEVSDGTLRVTFDEPSGNGAPISWYEVSTDDGASWQTADSSGTGRVVVTLTGLVNGRSLDVLVRAVNSAGAGGAAGPGPATPLGRPSAPTIIGAVPRPGSVSVSWRAPASTGGLPVTGYTVTAAPGGRTCSTHGATGCVVSGLTNGVLSSFTVRAANDLGAGVESAAVSATPIAVPGAPTSVAAARRAGAAVVTFTEPADTGGAPITGYVIRATGVEVRCDGSPCRVDGLTDGVAYRFGVAAVNRAGTGPVATDADVVIPADRPAAPTGLSVTARSGSVSLSFRAPAARGSDITGYLVSIDGGATWTTLPVNPGSVVTATLHGMHEGVPVGIAVRAVNGIGSGIPSATVFALPAAAPAAPTKVLAVPGDGSVQLRFSAPADHGSALTSYVVTVSPDDRLVECPHSPCTIDGLTDGDRYAFTVAAVNDVGTGPASSPAISAVPVGRPVAVAPPSVRLAPSAVEVSWSEPPVMPSSKVTGYTVTAWPGGASCVPVPATATHCSMSGLKTGIVYSFTVSVHETGGHSATSPRSRSIVLASFTEAGGRSRAAPGVAVWTSIAGALVGVLIVLVLVRRRRRRAAR